jgi:hypothetical protein
MRHEEQRDRRRRGHQRRRHDQLVARLDVVTEVERRTREIAQPETQRQVLFSV